VKQEGVNGIVIRPGFVYGGKMGSVLPQWLEMSFLPFSLTLG